MVDRIRYLLKRGELESARVLGTQLNKVWTRELGENDLQTLNIRFELANALRAQGKYQEARAMDEDTLARQISVLHKDHPGDDHPSILITTGSLARRSARARQVRRGAHPRPAGSTTGCGRSSARTTRAP